MLWEFLIRIFGNSTSTSSRIHARERLRLVLVHDRVSMSPYLMNRLKEDLLGVITAYMMVDEGKMELALEQMQGEVILKARIPVNKIRRDYADKIRSTS
jgi:cell division topological specificity factor